MNTTQPLARKEAEAARARDGRWDLVKTAIVDYDEPYQRDVTLWMKIPSDLQMDTLAHIAALLHTFLTPAFTEAALHQVHVIEEIKQLPLVGGWSRNDGRNKELKGPALKVVLSGEAAAEFRIQRARFNEEREREMQAEILGGAMSL